MRALRDMIGVALVSAAFWGMLLAAYLIKHQ